MAEEMCSYFQLDRTNPLGLKKKNETIIIAQTIAGFQHIFKGSRLWTVHTLCHLCGEVDGTREHYLFRCKELEEPRALTFGKYGYIRNFEDLSKIENWMDVFR